MSISAITSGNTYQASNIQSKYKQQMQDFQDLAGALQSGDLSGAQKAFTTLQNDLPNIQQGGQNNPLSSDFSDLASALKSGNLQDAQKAFAKLQQDMQAVQQGHHRHHHKKVANSTEAAGTSKTNASATDNGDSDAADFLNSVGTTGSSFEITA